MYLLIVLARSFSSTLVTTGEKRGNSTSSACCPCRQDQLISTTTAGKHESSACLNETPSLPSHQPLLTLGHSHTPSSHT